MVVKKESYLKILTTSAFLNKNKVDFGMQPVCLYVYNVRLANAWRVGWMLVMFGISESVRHRSMSGEYEDSSSKNIYLFRSNSLPPQRRNKMTVFSIRAPMHSKRSVLFVYVHKDSANNSSMTQLCNKFGDFSLHLQRPVC